MKKEINIHIGEYYACRQPTVIQTVLGSCVSVCLYDPVERIGGMNHILLPGASDMKRFNDSARYGINAMELLINRMMGLGAKRKNFIAKVFGGANVLPSFSEENSIGEQNINFSLSFLKNDKIRVLSQDLGGKSARRIYFHSDTGDVFVKRVPPKLHTRLAKEQEKEFQRVKNNLNVNQDVTFF
jgi:chemotaxis protein CheD